MNDKLAWYVARSSGWVAFVLLAFTVIWGILGITKIIERRGLPRWLLDLHRFLAVLTVVFSGIHLAALVADNYIHIGWAELFVPYALDWRPGAVAWGIVALYLIVAVQVSSWLRPYLPRRLWRGVHLLSYPALWMIAVHGLRAGSDAGTLPVTVGVMGVIGTTSFFTLMRVFGSGQRRRRVPTIEQPAVGAVENQLSPPTLVLDGPPHR
jgi:methionine sulfoxide reductase heme-binding subunit